MFYWYQKEYASGELYQAFLDVVVILPSGVSKTAFSRIKKLETDSDVLELMLCQLSCLVVGGSHENNLIVRPGGFTLKEGVGKCQTYCRKTSNGWLFQMERSNDSDFAISHGWQELSSKHPLADIVLIAGPSQHLNLP